jgi:uncharacterized protein (TIGR02145 family)
MKKFKTLKDELLTLAKEKQACEDGYEMGLLTKNKHDLVKAIVMNFGWCMANIINKDYLLENFTVEELRNGGYYTQGEDIKTLSHFWLDSIRLGGYYTFDDAQKVCPKGYRLPTHEEFCILVANTVYSFDGDKKVGVFTFPDGFKVEFPAAGYRNATCGALSNVGSNGAYWSFSPAGVGGYNLLFYSGSVNPSSNGNRAYGFSVRCIKNVK